MSELYPFQAAGVDWIEAQLNRYHTSFLADYMGLGKSVQAIKAADRMGIDFISVVAPAIAVEDWVRKFAEWSDYGREVFVGTHAEPVSPKQLPKKAVLVNSWNTMLTHRKLWHRHKKGGLLIPDEAHYAKNPTSQRARALYGGHCAGFNSVMSPFEGVLSLSGSPTPNGDPRELWPHLKALRPYLLMQPGSKKPMSYGDFGKEFCHFTDTMSDKVIGVKNMPVFGAILKRFMLRRLPDACPDLPPLRIELQHIAPKGVSLDWSTKRWPELAGVFQNIIANATAGDLKAQLQTEIATLRRQTGLMKIQLAVDFLREELEGGQLDKVVVFSYSTDVCKAIAEGLSKYGSSLITGDTPNAKRWEAIDRFQKESDRVMSSQILAGGMNLTLTAAHNVVLVETDWVPDNNMQAIYRCRRIGQKFPVLARVLSVTGTIDELMQTAAVRKMRQMVQMYGN